MTFVKESILASPFFSNLEVDETFDVTDHQRQIRQEAGNCLSQLTFPTTREEYWKYTRLGKWAKAAYKKPSISNDNFSISPLNGLDSIRVVFENGQFRADLSEKIDEAIKVLPLSEAKVKYPDLVDSYFGKLTNYNDHTFSAINFHYHVDGLFVYIPKGKSLAKTIECVQITNGNQEISNPKNLVILEESSNAEVIFRDYALGLESLINSTTEVVVGDNAHLKTYQSQRFGGNAQISTIDGVIGKDASYKNWLITNSGMLVRNNVNLKLAGENGTAEIYGVYIPKEKELIDNHTFIDHAVPNCYSNELYRGIIDDAAVATFNGKVMVRQHAQKTNAFQANNNILLSENGTINSKPELEIYADDVKCSHGSTTGQMDDEAIFYLRSRGVAKKQAINLMVQAFAHDVVNTIQNEAVKEYFNKNIDERFA